MKNRNLTLLMALMLLIFSAQAKDGNRIEEGDTIEVNFGDKGKILIHVENKEDLEALK